MHPLPIRLHRSLARLAPALLAGAAVLVIPVPAAAQNAAALYERAQTQERQAVSASPESADALRRVARAYESLVRRYPTSGYADNALWQAGTLMQRAFELAGDVEDRNAASRYFAWLTREYPHSSLARDAGTRASEVARLTAPAGATPTPADPPAPARAAAVRSISRTPLPRGDRITIELSSEVAYTGERVANPDRVFFDFANASAAAALADRARAIQSPLIKTARVGSPVRGVTRVVLELVGAPRFSVFPLYGPFRVVIDVESDPAHEAPPVTSVARAVPPPAPVSMPPVSSPPVPPAAATTPPPAATTPPAARASESPAAPAATPEPPARTRSGDYSLARQLGARVARVVIDPGHGGHDPGARANAVTEAELVLDVALRLEKLLLQQAGVEVVLTRRTNEFIPLEERTAIANREKADLFLSIHANAHRQTAVRGVETYFLNFATNPEAEAVAARENATSAQTMGTVPAIVKAIALNDKLAESREFASLLQTTLVRRLRGQSSATRDLGVKQAPFVVLIGAQMPSVLTEIAFLTNRSEASLLKQPAYRQHIAQALRDAVVRYQDSLKKITTVATRQPQQ